MGSLAYLRFQIHAEEIFSDAAGLEVFKMAEFPKSKIALHMPCEESNMFATKCMVCIYIYFLCSLRSETLLIIVIIIHCSAI